MNIAGLYTPVGRLSLAEENGAIVKLLWGDTDQGETTPALQEGLRQLEAFFAGERDDFDLPLAPAGSPFQQDVYKAMLAIPKGATRTYGDIANELGVPAQPVGQACGSNPIPVIIPCHRVVGAEGLGGYSAAGGVETKITLLKFENAYSLLL